jgi:hypothetical protein
LSKLPDSTITALSDPPLTEESLVEIRNAFGSKIITVARLIEITPWNPKSAKQGAKEFQRRIDEEIRKDN